MPDGTHDDLLRIAQDITDELDVDWDAAEMRRGASGSTLDGLRVLEQLAHAHKQVRDSVPLDLPLPSEIAAQELFRWGPLHVVERLGEGGFGEVFRAWDPRLEREVALKLRRTSSTAFGLPQAWLEEGRKLARVRHPHVVAVHGADIHDDRAGIWMDLLRGQTLEDRLAEAGTLGAGEARSIGKDLCSALAAVHAAGLVHGDVKASNVMREPGGQLVLMDFGSVHEHGSSESSPPPSITPLATAPEVLRGLPLNVAADVYSLGALLFRLTTGRYPVEGTDLAALLAAHRERGATPLRDLRPDLPATFVAVVDRALAADPADRFASVGEVERALGAGPESIVPSASARRPRWLGWATAAGLVLALGVAAIWPRGEAGPEAAGSLRFTATLLRTGAATREPLDNGARLTPGDRLSMEVKAEEPVHLYILNEDDAGHVYVLFPLPGQSIGNPIGADLTQRIPSALDGRPLDWVVTSAGGRERFLTIASREPLPELEARLATLEVADRSRPTMALELAMGEIRELLRGVGGIADAEVGATGSTGVLRELASGLQRRGGEGLWMRELELENPGR